MFDSLRDQGNASAPHGDTAGIGNQRAFDRGAPRDPARRKLFGLTALQRLIVAALLMISVCVLGTMCLLVTGRIGAF